MDNFEDMQSKFREEEYELRNQVMHDYHLNQLKENPELQAHFSKEYGVTKKSILLDAPCFHVVGQLPQDIMRIILEGAPSRTLFFVISYFVNNDIFSVHDLNGFILNFNYGYTEIKDKPGYISDEDLKDLHGNLAQIWLLSCVFVYFAEPFSHQCPDVWKKLLTKLEITAICLSKKISVNILGYLKLLIEEHLQAFKSVFNENITPKQHYLIHLPSQILKLGPLVRTWAMRFEGKHQQFKNIPKITKNFKNLPKTLAERHQSGVRADSIPLSTDGTPSDHPLFRREFICGTQKKELNQQDMDDANDCIKRFYPLFERELDNPIFQAASVTVHGTCYKKDDNTILAEITDSRSDFGSLVNIWFYGSFAFFL